MSTYTYRSTFEGVEPNRYLRNYIYKLTAGNMRTLQADAEIRGCENIHVLLADRDYMTSHFQCVDDATGCEMTLQDEPGDFLEGELLHEDGLTLDDWGNPIG